MAAVLQHVEHAEGLDYPLPTSPLSLVLRQDLGCIPGWPQTYPIANPPASPKSWDYRYVPFIFHGNCCLGALTFRFSAFGVIDFRYYDFCGKAWGSLVLSSF